MVAGEGEEWGGGGGRVFLGGILGLGCSTDGKTKGPEITLAKLGKAVSQFY